MARYQKYLGEEEPVRLSPSHDAMVRIGFFEWANKREWASAKYHKHNWKYHRDNQFRDKKIHCKDHNYHKVAPVLRPIWVRKTRAQVRAEWADYMLERQTERLAALELERKEQIQKDLHNQGRCKSRHCWLCWSSMRIARRLAVRKAFLEGPNPWTLAKVDYFFPSLG